MEEKKTISSEEEALIEYKKNIQDLKQQRSDWKEKYWKLEKDYLNQNKKLEELESKNLSLEREFLRSKRADLNSSQNREENKTEKIDSIIAENIRKEIKK